MQVKKRLWTVKDVAEYLGVPVGTLYDWRSPLLEVSLAETP